MEQQTGTGEDIFEPSDIEFGDVEQSVEDDQSPAVEETNEEQTDSQGVNPTESEVSGTKETETQTGDVDDEQERIDNWLAKKGIDTSKPEDISKLAKMSYHSEQRFYKNSQEKAKLERELANSQPAQSTPDRQALAEVRALKTQMDVEKWKLEKNLTPETEQKMMEWFAQPIIINGQEARDANGNPIVKGYMYANGQISLDEVYNIVGGNVNPQLEEKKQNLTEELRNEVKKEMSARQAAKSTKQGSTDSMQFDKPAEEDPFLEGLGF